MLLLETSGYDGKGLTIGGVVKWVGWEELDVLLGTTIRSCMHVEDRERVADRRNPRHGGAVVVGSGPSIFDARANRDWPDWLWDSFGREPKVKGR